MREPLTSKSVHLKLDPEVFEFFKQQGKGHITRMQNVLAAYVKAQKSR
nr:MULTISPECIES: BrnA antitoxin family protein [unclassified Devosia]